MKVWSWVYESQCIGLPAPANSTTKGPGACPEKDGEAGEESGAQGLWGLPDGTGIV